MDICVVFRLLEPQLLLDELSGDVNFGMVTVLLGKYEPSGDIESRVKSAEGHGPTIEAAVDDALGGAEDYPKKREIPNRNEWEQ